VTTLNRNPRPETPRGFRVRIKTDNPARRLVESTWKEEARAVLTPLPADDRGLTPQEVEIASALRQPRFWDEGVEARHEPRPLRAATSVRRSRTISARRQWEWWPVVVGMMITMGAIWQLVWAIR